MQFYENPLIDLPSCIQIIGPTGTGKTSLCAGLILYKDSVFSKPPVKIYYRYRVWSSSFNTFSNLDYVSMSENIPDENEIQSMESNSILFLDDLSLSVFNSSAILDLVMVRCRHQQISVVIVSHNLFTQGKYARTIHLNTGAYFLHSQRQDHHQITLLGRRCFPGNGDKFLKCYQDAIRSNHFSYLLVDLSLHTNDLFRLRSQILPTDEVMVIYKI